MKRIALLLALLASFALAATPTYNGASVQVMDVDGNATATTGTLTASAGSNRFLEVYVFVGTGSPDAHSGVTWGGQALTQRGSTLTMGPAGRISKWFLKEANFPASATGTITATLAGGEDEVWLVGVLYNDVDQTNPYKNAALTTNVGTASNNGTITVTSDVNTLVTGGTWEVDGGCTALTITETAGTKRQEVDVFTGGCEQGSVTDIAGGASNATLSWTYSVGGTADDWGAVGDALQYSAGGGGGGSAPPSGLLLRGGGK